ncbi:MAG: DUF2784 domain-containing protein [Gammaproteobacteria bacterium]
MLFRIAADAVLILHLAFILFVVLGAALAFRWRWTPLVHVPAAAWGIFIEISGGVCPLTYLENDLRHRAGQAGYSGGFIEHYLLSIIYPAGLTPGIQYMLAAIVLLVNLLLYGWLIRSRYHSIKNSDH